MADYPEQSESYLFHDLLHKPDNVHLCTTLISGGVSQGRFESFNLATHVGDDSSAVLANRCKLVSDLGLPSEPLWLNQVHSGEVVVIDDSLEKSVSESRSIDIPTADASISQSKDVPCVVLTADCLPVFICDRSGSEVAVAHAGWRGLNAGIISNTIDNMRSSMETLLFFLGPAIGPEAFEVGEDVRQAFIEKSSAYSDAFEPMGDGKYLCDI
jgi:YfiH family protein